MASGWCSDLARCLIRWPRQGKQGIRASCRNEKQLTDLLDGIVLTTHARERKQRNLVGVEFAEFWGGYNKKVNAQKAMST